MFPGFGVCLAYVIAGFACNLSLHFGLVQQYKEEVLRPALMFAKHALFERPTTVLYWQPLIAVTRLNETGSTAYAKKTHSCASSKVTYSPFRLTAAEATARMSAMQPQRQITGCLINGFNIYIYIYIYIYMYIHIIYIYRERERETESTATRNASTHQNISHELVECHGQSHLHVPEAALNTSLYHLRYVAIERHA